MRGSRLGRRVERQLRGSMAFREAFDSWDQTENQKPVRIVKILGDHDPRLRHMYRAGGLPPLSHI